MVSADLSWLLGLRRRGPDEKTMLWGQGYLRFSVYFSSSKSAVLQPSSDEETPDPYFHMHAPHPQVTKQQRIKTKVIKQRSNQVRHQSQPLVPTCIHTYLKSTHTGESRVSSA